MKDWTSYESEEEFKRYIIENSRRLSSKRTSFRDGFYQIDTGRGIVLLKERPMDDRDNFENEFRIGLLLNTIRNLTPNFVYTYGRGYTSDGQHILLSYVPGRSIAHFRGPFLAMLNYVIQTLLALELAYNKFGFTHYNLHRNNVVLKVLPERKLVPYLVDGKIIHFDTDAIPVIIDMGRSYTHSIGGHVLESKSVYSRANHFHDIYYFLNSTLGRIYTTELEEILSWYGVKPSENPCSIVDTLKPKVVSMTVFLEKARKSFGYTPHLRGRQPEICSPN